jgi:hypothetical protein
MPGKLITFDTVRDIGLTLPGVKESTAFGKPALKLHGQLLATPPSHRSAEAASLVVRMGFADRAELLAADPDVYYLTDHYLGYEAVLVRLGRVRLDVLRGLLRMAYNFVDHKAARSPARRSPKSRP